LDADFPEKLRENKELENQKRCNNRDQCSRQVLQDIYSRLVPDMHIKVKS